MEYRFVGLIILRTRTGPRQTRIGDGLLTGSPTHPETSGTCAFQGDPPTTGVAVPRFCVLRHPDAGSNSQPTPVAEGSGLDDGVGL